MRDELDRRSLLRLGGVAGDLLELTSAGLLGGAAWAGSAVLLARSDTAALARQLRR